MMKQIGEDVNNWQIWVKVTQECLMLSLPMSFKFYKNKNLKTKKEIAFIKKEICIYVRLKGPFH